MFHEVSAFGGREPDVNCLNKAGVMFQIITQHLLSQFVGLEATLGGNFG